MQWEEIILLSKRILYKWEINDDDYDAGMVLGLKTPW
jgi:hypothetical protein